jgi:hypothetical protein
MKRPLNPPTRHPCRHPSGRIFHPSIYNNKSRMWSRTNSRYHWWTVYFMWVCVSVYPFLPFWSYLSLPNLFKLFYTERQGGSTGVGGGQQRGERTGGGHKQGRTGRGGTDEEGSGYWELFGNVREHKTYQGRWRGKT